MTKMAMLESAEFGQFSSYASAQRLMGEHTYIHISASLIEKVTDYIGSYVYNNDTKRANETYDNMAWIDYEENGRKGVFYIMIDGSMANTRQKGKDGDTWKEVKLCLVFAGDDTRLRGKDTMEITNKEYAVYAGSVEEFKKRVFEVAVRNNCFEYEKIIVVSDGAAWIRTMCDELFPDAVQILDYYHLKENLYTFGRYIFDNDAKKYAPWVEILLHQLRHGQIEEALESLKEYAGKTYGAGIVNPHTYITHNKKKVDYGEYKRQGYCIGSGAIESGNKSVVQKRCKQAGMRWNLPNVQTMVTLRAKWESKLWKSSVCAPFLKSA
jgi:hypothetical protein